MRNFYLSFLFTLTVLTGLLPIPQSANAQHTELDHAHIARQALEKHIEPGYRRLQDSFAKLEAAIGKGCEHGGNAVNLAGLRDGFADAVKAWGAIAHIDFGPIRSDNRYERIWFWPDRKGIGQRQVASALKQRPEDYTGADTLAGKSIAVQGLGALEQIIYGPLSEPESADAELARFACAYAKAITGNLKTIAGKLVEAWLSDGEFGRLWLSPGPDHGAFIKPEETTFALIKAFTLGAERVRDVELARPLGVTESRRILPGPFANSELTMVFIATRISGLRSLMTETGLSSEMLRTAQAEKDDQAKNELKQLELELKLVDQRAGELAAIPDLLGESPQRSEAVALGFPLKSVRQLAQSATGRLTNLPVGFNASDGD